MATLKVLVGLSGSGKSTFAAKLEEVGYKVVSSDALREQESTSDNNKLFEELYKTLKESLVNNIDCIFDATNLTKKKRMHLLNVIHSAHAKTECIVFVTPIPVCKENNRKRENKHGVTDEVIDKMAKTFNIPVEGEGFDEIHFCIWSKTEGLTEKEIMGYEHDTLNEIDQDNPHHSLTIGEHEKKVDELIIDKYIFTEYFPFLRIAAKYHDDGKYFTKTFQNMKGEVTDTAHFYNHENVGAYLFLVRGFCLRQFTRPDDYPLTDWAIVHIATIINLHMRPMNAWEVSEKAKKKDLMIYGEEVVRNVEALSWADKQGK